MCSDYAVTVDSVSKCYQIYEQPRDRLKQFVLPRLYSLLGRNSKTYFREFWALHDVSFRIKRGETVGIIGKNGSGKSTLLQIICGTLNPTGGNVQTRGRIGALLELGSGFNPEFTGRENIYMNASVLGLTKEQTDECYDDILSFADIGSFIEQPVKTYSSGMMVRLAFAVQAQVSPDILIVDEALAVGDAKFQAKCFKRLKQLKNDGTSILLVTHANEQIITHCDHAILLNEGRVLEQGAPKDVVNRYLDLLFGKERGSAGANADSAESTPSHRVGSVCTGSDKLSLHDEAFPTRPGYNPHEYRWGDGTVTILDYFLRTTGGRMYPSTVQSGEQITLGISVRFNHMLVRPIFGITIKTKEGVTVYGTNSETLDVPVADSVGEQGGTAVLTAVFDCTLASGDYFVSLGVATHQGGEIVPHDRRYDAIHLQVVQEKKFFGLVDLGFEMKIEGISQ